MSDLEERLTKLIAGPRASSADASLKEKIRSEVAEGMEEDPARIQSCASRWKR